MEHTVGEVAALASVSVRTLHHYDEIGLLSPSGRSDSGYRHYDDEDLARLQQVLFFKELGFALADIARIMNAPDFDRLQALRTQRRLLEEKALRFMKMADAVDTAIGAREGGVTLDAKEMLEVFGDFDPKEYEQEAEERWGGTEAYAESMRRTRRYTKEDWLEIGAAAAKVNEALAMLMDEGVPADDPRAMDLAERHRLQIDRWFYPCSYEIQTGLGEMYVADPRFAKNYESVRPGLAAYLRDAILANAVHRS